MLPARSDLQAMTSQPGTGRPRPRVCHVAATTEGATWVFEQLRDLRDRHGYDVCAILNGDKGGLVDKFKAAGIAVHAANFDFTASSDLLRLPHRVMALYRLMRRERFDVVQTHLFQSMVLGRIAAWFADVPVRLSMIAGPFHLEAYTPRWIDRWTCWLDTAIIASCEYTRLLYRKLGVPDRKIEVIYYGPDERKFDPTETSPADLRGPFGWPSDTPLVGMVAYFYQELPKSHWLPPALCGRSVKSQEDLIRAAPIILDKFPRAKILLIGSGWEAGGEAYLQRMKDLVGTLDLERSIAFTGFRNDVPQVLRALDVAVQPSLSENLGGTIESLLMECPTVATSVGGMTDSVIDGQTGVLVRPADPQSLAEGIVKVLGNPETARRYGAAGRQRMLERFTLRRTVDDLAALYERELAGRPAGYRRWVIIRRFAAGSLLCLAVVTRYAVWELFVLRVRDRAARWLRARAA
jgi:glycosyltransferase involved in cell wall biosynthesis